MKRKFIFILSLILLLPFVKGYEFGASPDELYFEGELGEKICENLKIISDEPAVFNLKDYWSLEDNRFLENYILNSDEVGIEIDYDKVAIVRGKEISVPVCIISNKNEQINGLLIIEHDSFQVGVWIKGDFSGKGANFINGNAILSEFNEEIEYLPIGLAISCVLLTVFLAILLYYRRKTY